MKSLKILSAFFFFSFILASCNKESLTITEDNPPEVVVEEVVVEEEGQGEAGEITVGTARYNLNEVFVATFIDNDGSLVNYQVGLNADLVGVSGECGGFAFTSEDPSETSLQETTYMDLSSTGFWVTQEGIDAFAAWEAAGANPSDMPNIVDYLIQYDASAVSYTFSNLTETTVDVELSGEMTDLDGNTVPVSGSFTASLL
ncbi:MAG: hypothetical protein AAF985_01915 [Bacteroidota bacterium]